MINLSELLASLSETQSLLERFCKALGGSIVKSRTPDGWDWELYIVLGDRVIYYSCGFYIAEIYDRLLKAVMTSNGWGSVDEMKIWLDLHDV